MKKVHTLLIVFAFLVVSTIITFQYTDLRTPKRSYSHLPAKTETGINTASSTQKINTPAVTLTDPKSVESREKFKKDALYFESLREGDLDLIKIRSFVREHFFANQSDLIEWLGDLKNENKQFLNAYREFGELAIENNREEEYYRLFENVTELQAVALFDGAVTSIAARDPVAAFEYRQGFIKPLGDSRAQYDSFLIGKAVSSGKGKEALEAVDRFVSGKLKPNAIADVFYSWADYDPQSAIPHLDAIDDAPTQALARKKFFERWATRDPSTLTGWLSNQPQSVKDIVLTPGVKSKLDR